MHATYILSALALALPVYSATSLASLGCYSEVGSLKSQGPFTFQSPGYCQDKCSKKGFKVAALGRGDLCYCGNDLPPQSAKVDDEKCNDPCSGYPSSKCGGNGAYSFIQSTEAFGSSGSDSDNASTTAAPTAATAAGGIVVAPSTAAAPTGIITAASSVNSKSANTASSKSAGSATAAASSSANPTPSGNAAGTVRAGSSLIGAVVAGMGLLL